MDPKPSDEKRPTLFRRVAIDAASGTQFGDPLNTYWRGVTFFTVLAALLVAALVALTFVVEYAPIYRVPSYVDVAGGLVRLSAPADGRVRALAVEEGAKVRAGDVLATLDSDIVAASGASRRDTLKAQLQREQQGVGREIQAAREETAAAVARSDNMVTGLRAERQTLVADIKSGEELLSSLRSQSQRIGTLAGSGYATQIQAAKANDEVLAQQSRIAASRASLNRVERDIEVALMERRVASSRFAGLVESRQRASGELERQILQADSEAEQVIRSPEDGIISSALIARGQSVELGQVLFTLMPTAEPVIVRLVVPPRAAASVKTGQDIKVVFQAYPQEKFGTFDARIDRVSSTPSMPADVPVVYAIREPAFIAVASLVGQPRGPEGQPLALKPGMLVDALVPVEKRRAIEWLLDPILRGFNDSVGRPRSPPAGAGAS